MRKVLSICPYCGCGCGLYLHVEDDRLLGVSPSRNHPVNAGSLCVKGWNAHEFVNHPERLRYPMARKNGQLERVSWDEALSTVADRFRTIKSESGPDALSVLSSAKCTNEENYIMMKFSRAVLGTNNIDHCARL